jgi:hypothetical protein
VDKENNFPVDILVFGCLLCIIILIQKRYLICWFNQISFFAGGKESTGMHRFVQPEAKPV